METEFIERGVSRFGNKIFNKYINDWINLLLFIGANNIRISKRMEESIFERHLNTIRDLDSKIIASIYIVN
ncbi:hypothetical protein [Tetragenococcus halophilus]|uniref:hypothetical protein n=1 Tax=Tetragenococcus halophilus TaxID=51669 RepID=UPI0024031B38|nr:hypothetical protein [Tetragenococcus halophilus]GLL52305.1 hypothetical protein YA5_022840 [Tetragenococcus halophilus]